MHFYLAILAFVLANFQMSQCQQCSFEVDIDYYGNDLSTQPIFVNSADLCCASCSQNVNCQAWTYLPSTRACWLKRQIGSTRLNSPGRYSGVKQQSSSTLSPTVYPTAPTTTYPTTIFTTAPTTTTAPSTTRSSACFIEENVNYPGDDIGGEGNVASAGDCCTKCSSRANCTHWQYFIDFRYCYFKSGNNGSRQNYAGMIAGVVTIR